jgi:ribosomal protein L37E
MRSMGIAVVKAALNALYGRQNVSSGAQNTGLACASQTFHVKMERCWACGGKSRKLDCQEQLLVLFMFNKLSVAFRQQKSLPDNTEP